MVQSVAYATGFETGDASEVNAVEAGTASVQTAVVRTGGYALKATGGSPLAVFNFIGGLSASSAIARVYFQISAAPEADTQVLIIDFDNGGTNLVYLWLDTNSILHIVDSAAVDTAGTTVLSVNTWYRIEFSYVAVGAMKCLLNGATEISATDSGAGITIVRFRARGDSVADCYWDDMRLDTGGTTAIGAGQTIARQGIAGTPTYNAWTKNGAATAALCLSDTPFSTATNISDLVLNDAQTMLVDKFSTDPGRAVEGTQVIGASDTINAVWVCMIAKTAVAGNIVIRRRVGGADTDETVALTTSDAYYRGSYFTDTPANLDAYEIGVKNALVATTETVEDMWMMVDYTPAAGGAAVKLTIGRGLTHSVLLYPRRLVN